MDELEIGQAAFCGLSMGGMTGMWLGVHAPSRFSHLVLCNTAARIGTPEVWNGRIAAVRQGGMGGIVQGVIQRWFTEGFVTAEPAAVEKISAMLLATAPEGYCGACEAVRDMDQRKWLELAGAPLCPIEDHGQMQHEPLDDDERSEEHTSELQSLMRISYAVFCLKKKTKQNN